MDWPFHWAACRDEQTEGLLTGLPPSAEGQVLLPAQVVQFLHFLETFSSLSFLTSTLVTVIIGRLK